MDGRTRLILRVNAMTDNLRIDAAQPDAPPHIHELLGEAERFGNDLCHIPSAATRASGATCYTLRAGLAEFTRLRCVWQRRTTPDHRY